MSEPTTSTTDAHFRIDAVHGYARIETFMRPLPDGRIELGAVTSWYDRNGVLQRTTECVNGWLSYA